MKLILGISTYNRLNFLKKTIETWKLTKNSKYDWMLIIADDGSTDGTLDYLKNIDCILIKNKNRGVHYQTNKILQFSSKLDFNYGFKSDDDVIFKLGWDEAYIEAMQKTGYDHLCFFDPDYSWGKGLWWEVDGFPKTDTPIFNGPLWCPYENLWPQGAFWTFTSRIIEKVGYFDLKNLGLCGGGHMDYTFRCCRANFNCLQSPFDIKERRLELIKENYKSASKLFFNWNSKKIYQKKLSIIKQDRIYIPYNAIDLNMFGNKVYKNNL